MSSDKPLWCYEVAGPQLDVNGLGMALFRVEILNEIFGNLADTDLVVGEDGSMPAGWAEQLAVVLRIEAARA